MKILFLNIAMLVGFSVSLAQSNCTIKKAYAWYNVSIPGAQMADENGNPIPPTPNITRIIYVEYSGTKVPEIKSVIYSNIAMDFTVLKVKEKTVSIGDKKLNPNNTITAKKGNSFLKLTLKTFEVKTMPETDCKNIVIKGKSAGKLCQFLVGSEKEFAAPPRY